MPNFPLKGLGKLQIHIKRHSMRYPEEDLQLIIRGAVKIAVAVLKKGKSVGVDNIPAKLVQAGGET